MSIWEMKDAELVCNVEFLPSYLAKGRPRRMSQMCPSLAEWGKAGIWLRRPL